MIVDRRKDSYDELQILAGDARIRRRRTNIWTTGLIVGSMVLAGAYVSVTSEQAEQLGNAKEISDRERDVAQTELERARNQIAILTAERDMYEKAADTFATIAPQLDLSNAVRGLRFRIPADPANPVAEERLSNVVWVVDGSRRFPVTDGDILWIPEGNFWVQLESEADTDPFDPDHPTNAGRDPDDTTSDGQRLRKVTLYRDRRPTNNATGGQELFLGGAGRYYEELGDWPEGTHGSFDCVQLTLHYSSRRPGFSADRYLDLEVLLYNSNRSCPTGDEGGRVIPDPAARPNNP